MVHILYFMQLKIAKEKPQGDGTFLTPTVTSTELIDLTLVLRMASRANKEPILRC